MKITPYLWLSIFSLTANSFVNAQTSNTVETGSNVRAVTVFIVYSDGRANVKSTMYIPRVVNDDGTFLDERFQVSVGNAIATVNKNGAIINPSRNLRSVMVSDVSEINYDPVKSELRISRNRVSKRGLQRLVVLNQDNQRITDIPLD